MKKKQKNNQYVALELLIDGLLIISLVLLTYPLWKDKVISQQINHQAIIEYANELPEAYPIEEKIHSLSLQDSLKQIGSKELTMYGTIQIPELDWIQPLYVGMTNQNLFYGGVVMFPTRTLAKENMVIFGHHLGLEQLLFGQLVTNARVGQEIIVSYLDEVRTYRISDIFLIDEQDLTILESSDTPVLTVFTCPTPVVTSQRFVIRAYPETNVEQLTLKHQNKQLQKVTNYQKEQSTVYKINYIVILILLFIIILVNRMLFKYYLK